MAHLIGEPEREAGDRRVYELLSKFPSEWFIYAQPTIVYKGAPHHPDYVLIHKDLGVVVLEVKDRGFIVDIQPDKLIVKREGRIDEEDLPIIQVKNATFALTKKLQEDDFLRNHAGKLDFPYRYGVVFTYSNFQQLKRMRECWGNLVIGQDDLNSPESLQLAIKNLHIPPRRWNLPLSNQKIDAIRAAVRPENKVQGLDGQIKGIYSPQQESLANESLPVKPLQIAPTAEQRRLWLEEQTIDEARSLTIAPFVRLIRGVAGTGKTDVLVLRAYYLHKTYPDMQILVTTFNRPLVDERLKLELGDLPRVDVLTFASLCSEIRKAKFPDLAWCDPQNTRGVLNALAQERFTRLPFVINRYGIDFLEREIQWMKEMQISNLQTYLQTSRRGVAGLQGKRISEEDKRNIYQLYEAYQTRLSQLPALDWHDFYNQALQILEEGYSPPKQYDAILVDEAQHYAPGWIRVLLRLLKPNGHLFLCDDPTQGVYRNYTWKERGVNVVGRTRWLRVPYRYTRQIAKFLTEFINGNQSLMELG